MDFDQVAVNGGNSNYSERRLKAGQEGDMDFSSGV